MHLRGEAKLHFALCGVNIHINRKRVNAQIKHHQRVATLHQQRVVSAFDHGDECATGLERAPVDKEVHIAPRTSGEARGREHPGNGDFMFTFAGVRLNCQQLAGHFESVEFNQHGAQVAVAACLEGETTFEQQAKTHLGVGQGVLLHHRTNRTQFGGIGAEILAAHGRVVKEVTHAQTGAGRTAAGHTSLHFTARKTQLGANFLVGGAREADHLGHGSNGGERLATKAKGTQL